MIVIIAGSRSIRDMAVLEQAIESSKYDITEVVSGGAGGVDSLGEEWALKHRIRLGPDFSVPDYEWKKSRAAGIRRNEKMAKYVASSPQGGGLIAVWDGTSPGTKHMIGVAREYRLLVYVHRVPL